MIIPHKPLILGVLLWCLLGGATRLDASVLIYSYNGTSTTSGDGAKNSATHTGFLVFDSEGNSLTYIGQFSTGSAKEKKNYWLSYQVLNPVITQIAGSNGTTITTTARAAVSHKILKFKKSVAIWLVHFGMINPSI